MREQKELWVYSLRLRSTKHDSSPSRGLMKKNSKNTCASDTSRRVEDVQRERSQDSLSFNGNLSGLERCLSGPECIQLLYRTQFGFQQLGQGVHNHLQLHLQKIQGPVFWRHQCAHVRTYFHTQTHNGEWNTSLKKKILNKPGGGGARLWQL